MIYSQLSAVCGAEHGRRDTAAPSQYLVQGLGWHKHLGAENPGTEALRQLGTKGPGPCMLAAEQQGVVYSRLGISQCLSISHFEQRGNHQSVIFTVSSHYHCPADH